MNQRAGTSHSHELYYEYFMNLKAGIQNIVTSKIQKLTTWRSCHETLIAERNKDGARIWELIKGKELDKFRLRNFRCVISEIIPLTLYYFDIANNYRLNGRFNIRGVLFSLCPDSTPTTKATSTPAPATTPVTPGTLRSLLCFIKLL